MSLRAPIPNQAIRPTDVASLMRKPEPKRIPLGREDAKAMFSDRGGITNKLFSTQDSRLLCTITGPRLFMIICMVWEELDREATAIEIANRIGISRRSTEKHMRYLKKVLHDSLGININRDLKSKIWAPARMDSVAKDARKIEKETKRIQKKIKNLKADIHTVYLQTGKRMHGLISEKIINSDMQYQN